MSLTAVLTALDLLDSAQTTGHDVADAIFKTGLETVETIRIEGERGATDVIRCLVPGKDGRLYGGNAPTLGIIGRRGGLGARPEQIGLIGEGDGAAAAIACALKLGRMRRRGDGLAGDVIIATHICPNASARPLPPAPFMAAPDDMAALNREEVKPAMDAVLSIDTARANRLVNHRGFAISPTVKCGWILRVSEDLLDIQQIVTGRLPVVLPISMQDITPYDNGVYHLTSILQPATITEAPVVGIALTAEAVVPGSATGGSQSVDLEQAVRFAIEVGKAFGRGRCQFYDRSEWDILQQRHGAMNRLQDAGWRLV